MTAARYIDTAEVAKLLRPFLKRGFPAVKFSVRIERYAGGSSVNVFWTDGPTVDQVEAVANGFRGGRFEGMTDCAYSANSWYCPQHGARVAETYGCDVSSNNDVHTSRCCAKAELVHFMTGHVFANRTISPEFTAELRAEVIRQSGLPADADSRTRLPEMSPHWHGTYDTVQDGIYRLSREMARTS
ncbi:MAG TPA: LPD29 domain-containing protein [Pseudonocardiaceae bacterium]|jgi:hypothetical protein